MSCKIAIVGVLFLVHCTSNVYAALNAGCTAVAAGDVGDCEGTNHEVCDADSKCICDSDTGYVVAADTTTCELADCTGATVDAGYLVTGDKSWGGTATVACDSGSGYSGSAAAITCGLNSQWDAFSGCTLSDCTSATVDAGYLVTGDKSWGGTATVACDSGSGYSGTAAAITCGVNSQWDAFSGCTLSDCTSATVDAGYLVTGDKSWGGSPTVNCDAGSGYTGTAAAITCGLNSQWSAFSGCTSSGGGGGSVDLGNPCANDGECTSGNGGSGSKCGTSTNCECDASRNYVASGSTCKLATDLGNACSANEECTLGNGGAGGTCSSTSNNCECDEASGYTQTGTSCTQNAGSALLSMFNVVSMLAFILIVKLM